MQLSLSVSRRQSVAARWMFSVGIFEFSDAEAAEALLFHSLPNIKMQKAIPYYWFVESLDSVHCGHCELYRECERNMNLTYAMKMTSKTMTESGISVSKFYLTLQITCYLVAVVTL